MRVAVALVIGIDRHAVTGAAQTRPNRRRWQVPRRPLSLTSALCHKSVTKSADITNLDFRVDVQSSLELLRGNELLPPQV